MVPEDLHTGFSVGVVGRLEAQLVDTHLGEEDFHESDQSAQRESEVCNHTLDLVEFSQVGCVNGLVAEDTIDGEEACRARVGGEFVQHVG